MVDQVKIVLTTQDDTQAGFDAVQRNSEKTRKALDDLYASAERIGRGGGSFDGQVESARLYYETIDRINRQLATQHPDQTGSAIERVQASAEKLGSASEGVDRMSGSLDKARQQAEETAKAFSKITIGPAQIEMSDGAIKGLTDKLEKIDLSGWQAKMAYGMAAGVGAGVEATRTALDKLEDWAKAKVIITGVAIATGIAAAALTAVYAAYKAGDFLFGLITGKSYKSENIDALIALNAEVVKLQNGLKVSAADASALNEALKLKGVDQSAYIATFDKATSAIHTNGEELSRLGIKYKDTQGNLLPLNDTMASAAMVLATYTDGWDRHQAAVAIGMGSEKDIQKYLSVTRESIEQSRQRLVDYGLVIGAGTQAAVERYKTAMREFENESELTSQGFKKAIADQIMPALTDLAESFKNGWPGVVSAFRYTMAQITSLLWGLKSVNDLVLQSVSDRWSVISVLFGGIGQAIEKSLVGDFSGAEQALVSALKSREDIYRKSNEAVAGIAGKSKDAMKLAWGAENLDPTQGANLTKGKAWDDGKAAKAAREASADWKKLYATQAEEKKAAFKELDDAYGKETVTVGNNLQKQLDLAKQYQTKRAEIDKKFEPKKEADPYGDLIKQINLKLSIQQQEIDGTAKLTESEKVRAKAQQDILDGTLKLTAAQKAYLYGKLDLLVTNEKSIAQESAIQKAITERYQAGEKELEQIQQQIDAQTEHNAVIGLTPAQIEAVKAARLDEEIVAKQTLLRIFDENGVRGAQVEIIREQVVALDKLRQAHVDGALKQAEADAAKKSAEAWQKGWEDTDRVARQIFDVWGVKGSNAAEQIGRTLRSALFSAIYEATLRPVVFQIYGAMTTALGVPGAPGASALGSNVGSLASNGSSLYNAYGALSGSGAAYGFGSAATSFASSSVGQAFGLSETVAGAAPGAVGITEAGSSLIGAASSIGAAMPYIAAALVAAQVLGLFSQDIENPQFTPTYGRQGNGLPGFTREGNFGTIGFAQAPSDAAGSKWAQQFLNFGGQVDNTGASLLGWDKGRMGTVTDKLTGVTQRTDGQPLQWSFPKLDEGSSKEVTTEWAKVVLGGVLDEVGKNLGDVVREMGPQSVDQVLAFAGSVKSAQQVMQSLGQSSDALSKDLVTAMGGADGFSTGIKALNSILLTPLDRSISAVKDSRAGLISGLSDAGLGHGALAATALDIKAYAAAIDLTGDAGKKSFAQLATLAEQVRSYQDQVIGLAGLTRDSLTKTYLDALKAAPSAAAAGQAVADVVVGGIENSMLSSYAGQITDIMIGGIVTPAIDAMLQGQAISEALSQASIDKAVKQAQATAAAFAEIWNDADFKSAMATIKTSVASVGAAGYVPHSSYTSSISSPVVNAATDTAAQNAADVKKTMAGIADDLAAIGRSDIATSLAGINQKYTDQKSALVTASGATADNIALLDKWSVAMKRNAIDTAAIAAAQGYLSATGNTAGGGQLATDLAKGQDDKATGGLASAFGVDLATLNKFLDSNGGLAASAVKYWSQLSDAQQAATITAVNARAGYISAVKSQFDAQAQIVSTMQGWIDQVKGFISGIDKEIFSIQLSQSSNPVAMLKAQEADLWKQMGDYKTVGDLTTENVQHQLDLAGQIKDNILQRYQIETAAVQKLTGFAQNLGDYVNGLKVGDLSPLSMSARIAEAKAQYDQIVATLRDPNASSDARDLASGKYTNAADTYLKLQQQYNASGSAYVDAYNQVTADANSLGADTLTEAQRQTAELSTLASKAASTITELQGLRGFAQLGATALDTMIAPEIKKLGTIAESLGDQGAIAKAINGLPNEIALQLSGLFGGKTAPTITTAPGGAVSSLTDSGTGSVAFGGNWSGTVVTADQIRAGVNSQAAAGATGVDIYNQTKASGMSLAQLDSVMGWGTGAAESWAKANNLPSFDVGINYVPHDMLANIHAGEEITPRPYVDLQRAARDETNQLLGRIASNTSQSVAELQRMVVALVATNEVLTKKVEDMSAQLEAIDATGRRELART